MNCRAIHGKVQKKRYAIATGCICGVIRTVDCDPTAIDQSPARRKPRQRNKNMIHTVTPIGLDEFRLTGRVPAAGRNCAASLRLSCSYRRPAAIMRNTSRTAEHALLHVFTTCT